MLVDWARQMRPVNQHRKVMMNLTKSLKEQVARLRLKLRTLMTLKTTFLFNFKYRFFKSCLFLILSAKRVDAQKSCSVKFQIRLQLNALSAIKKLLKNKSRHLAFNLQDLDGMSQTLKINLKIVQRLIPKLKLKKMRAHLQPRINFLLCLNVIF